MLWFLLKFFRTQLEFSLLGFCLNLVSKITSIFSETTIPWVKWRIPVLHLCHQEKQSKLSLCTCKTEFPSFDHTNIILSCTVSNLLSARLGIRDWNSVSCLRSHWCLGSIAFLSTSLERTLPCTSCRLVFTVSVVLALCSNTVSDSELFSLMSSLSTVHLFWLAAVAMS